ncbi:MAG: prolipoprotein diacylglyceryl transferase [Capsulimonas sp.]|uniref:prolipoprotein diacylglyceryl transferase n=1 Tax=Capsulimonas sp. TaxID=2494211 RepID=UPI0032665FC0
MHPILFRIGAAPGGYAVHTFGVMMMLAFAVGIWRAVAAARRQKGEPGDVPVDAILDAGTWMILAGIAGARLMFIIVDWSSYRDHPLSGLEIWNGGLSFHGALFGGLLALIVFCLIRRISILKITDLFAPSVMLSYAIGRIGCFFNGCCYGAPTTMPWGIRFNEDGQGHWTVPSHPTQMYSTILSLIFFGVLVWLERRKAFDGQLLCWYIILSATERFLMEIWRGGVTSTVVAWGLTDVQFLCLSMIALAGVGLAVLRRVGRRSSPGNTAALEVAGH